MDRPRPTRQPTVVALALLALAVIALGVSAWFLATTQSQQRRDLRERYTSRTAVAASLIDALFRTAFNAQTAQDAQLYSGPKVSQARLNRAVKEGRLVYSMVVDAHGKVLGATSRAPKPSDSTVPSSASTTASVT